MNIGNEFPLEPLEGNSRETRGKELNINCSFYQIRGLNEALRAVPEEKFIQYKFWMTF